LLEHLRAVEVSHTKVSYQAAEALYKARDEECAISDNWCCGCMAFTPRRELSDARDASRTPRVH
jgi:hypothetical protein